MRKMISVGLVLMMAVGFTACSSTTVTFDSEGFMGEVATLTLEDQLVEIPTTAAEIFYDLSVEGIESYILYGSGTRATACEVMVVTVEDESSIEDVEKMMTDRKNDLIAEYEDYIPAEVDRIEDSICVTKGNTVILAITGENETIETLIDTYTTEK